MCLFFLNSSNFLLAQRVNFKWADISSLFFISEEMKVLSVDCIDISFNVSGDNLGKIESLPFNSWSLNRLNSCSSSKKRIVLTFASNLPKKWRSEAIPPKTNERRYLVEL